MKSNRIVGVMVAGALAGAMLLSVTTAGAQDFTKDELKCQTKTGDTQAKFASKKGGCIVKCMDGGRKGKNPFTDCVAPAFGGKTAECVSKEMGKAVSGVAKSCTKDCPECYGANCNGTQFSNTTEIQVDTFPDLIWCGDPAALTDTQFSCAQATGKALSKYVTGAVKAAGKCVSSEFSGKVAPGSCTPPPTDPTEQAAIAKAAGKAVSSIDGACTDPPPCWAVAPVRNNGAAWTAIVQAIINSNYTTYYCGSPSGAFLE